MELVGQSKPERVLLEGSLFDTDPDLPAGYTNANLGLHTLAAPLLQIFSVRIHTMFDDGKPCEIYGSLQATQGQGTTFELYGRDACEAETIWKDGSLTLINQKDHAILGVTRVSMDLDIKDRIRNIELVKKRYYLESATEGTVDSNNKLKIGVVQGEHSVVYLYYMAFQFAISATVEIEIDEIDNGSERFADVYGRLVASYSNNMQYCNNDGELKYLETVLFDRPSNQPVRIVTGTPVKLISAMAVPAYSSLVINADLFGSQGQFISGRKVFPAVSGLDCTDSIQSINGCLRVTVTFTNPYLWIYEDSKIKDWFYEDHQLKELDRESNTESSKNVQVLGFPKTYPSSCLNLNGDVPKSICWGLVEIFSVYVGGINHAVRALSGTIEIHECIVPDIIYNVDMNDPEVLSEDKLVPIEMDFALRNEQLCLSVDLKDPTQNLEVSKGYISWFGGCNIRKYWGMSWYDKRICSVIRGSNGYAAVHYMIMYCGVIASVEVVYYCENSAACLTPNICGTLLAYYGGHEYYTDYDKSFHRSRLFQKPQNKPAILGAGSSSIVPLSKSVVAVPANTSLFIEADLEIIFDDSSQFVTDKKEFVIDMSSTTCKEILGKDCRFEVSIKFRNPFGQ